MKNNNSNSKKTPQYVGVSQLSCIPQLHFFQQIMILRRTVWCLQMIMMMIFIEMASNKSYFYSGNGYDQLLLINKHMEDLSKI